MNPGRQVADPLSLESAVAALRWEGGTATVTAWRARFAETLEARLGSLAGADAEFAAVMQALEALAPAARGRFLRAPAVSSLILQPGDDRRVVVALLESLLMGELVAENLVAPLEGEVHWSARGDVRVPPSSSGRVGGAPPRPGGGLVLDVASPFRFSDDAYGIAGGTIVHRPDELRAAEHSVAAAVHMLESIAEAAELVDTFIEVLALRRERGRCETFQSSTFSGLVGLVRFTNAHLPVSPARIGEALVHEATHGMLYLYEELHGPFLAADRLTQDAARSPWTGAPLSLASYIQACAVWYAVYHYWAMALGAGVCDASEGAARLELARRGFGAAPAASLIDRYAPVLSTGAIELLGRLDEATGSLPGA